MDPKDLLSLFAAVLYKYGPLVLSVDDINAMFDAVGRCPMIQLTEESDTRVTLSVAGFAIEGGTLQ